MMIESDVSAPDRRVLHVYDTAETTGEAVVYWQHGAGMSGGPPAPLVERASALGLRVIGHDRPGYGSSTPLPGRRVADAARDLVSVLDALGVESATTIGLSAGAMHALAAVAVEPVRFTAAAVVAGPAPYGAARLDWFANMAPANRHEFEAALLGRDALTAYLARNTEVDLGMFSPEDLEAMHGPYWDWQLHAAGPAMAEGSIEDELACVADWGFHPHEITSPVLVIHGARDTFVPASHARWVAGAIPRSVLRLEPGGHISTIPASEHALAWLRAQRVPRVTGQPAAYLSDQGRPY
jgi:pimeloyl-ACP methyl ester carboxylesterase